MRQKGFVWHGNKMSSEVFGKASVVWTVFLGTPLENVHDAPLESIIYLERNFLHAEFFFTAHN